MLHPFQSSPNDQLHQILQNKKDMLPTLALNVVLSQIVFSILLQSSKNVQNHYSELYPLKNKMLRMIWGHFIRDWSQLENFSEIKPPLCDYPDSVLPKPWLNPK